MNTLLEAFRKLNETKEEPELNLSKEDLEKVAATIEVGDKFTFKDRTLTIEEVNVRQLRRLDWRTDDFEEEPELNIVGSDDKGKLGPNIFTAYKNGILKFEKETTNKAIEDAFKQSDINKEQKVKDRAQEIEDNKAKALEWAEIERKQAEQDAERDFNDRKIGLYNKLKDIKADKIDSYTYKSGSGSLLPGYYSTNFRSKNYTAAYLEAYILKYNSLRKEKFNKTHSASASAERYVENNTLDFEDLYGESLPAVLEWVGKYCTNIIARANPEKKEGSSYSGFDRACEIVKLTNKGSDKVDGKPIDEFVNRSNGLPGLLGFIATFSTEGADSCPEALKTVLLTHYDPVKRENYQAPAISPDLLKSTVNSFVITLINKYDFKWGTQNRK